VGSKALLKALAAMALLAAPAMAEEPAKQPPQALKTSAAVEEIISSAVKLYKALEYERALDELKKARALSPDRDASARIYLHEGIIYAGMGEVTARDKAMDSFEQALLLKPDLKLPLMVSPKVERDFETTRKLLAEQRAKQARPSPPDDRPTTQKVGPTPPVISAPSQPPSENFFGALPKPHIATLALGGGAVVTGLGGLIFGLMASGAFHESQIAVFADAKAQYYQSGVTSARVANTLYICAGLSAAASVATYFLLPHD